jgi:hypothetical protein
MFQTEMEMNYLAEYNVVNMLLWRTKVYKRFSSSDKCGEESVWARIR